MFPVKYLTCLFAAFLSILNSSLAYHSFYRQVPQRLYFNNQNFRRPLRQIQPDSFNWNDLENQQRPPQNDAILFEDDYPNLNVLPMQPWQISSTERPRGSSTVAVPGMGTTRSPCEEACLITSEYNPVCGSNGITYTNDRRLQCAINCGQQISRAYFGRCTRGQ